jgi:hypothetical protein
MLSYLFFFLAGSANAFMDTVTFRPDRSVFKNMVEKVSPMHTYLTYKPFLGIVRLDFWHLAKYCMMGFFALAVYFGGNRLGFWDLLIYPMCWHIGFESFWGYILYRPKNVLEKP